MQRRALVVLVALVLIAFVVVDGFLAYRYYGRLAEQRDTTEAAPASPSSAPQTTTSETTEPEATAKPSSANHLVQGAAASNIITNSTYIDNPLTNGAPDVILLVTRARGSGGSANYAHEIGVWYDRYRGGKWAIFNQDLAPMQEGSTFEVVVLERPDGFVHSAEPANTEENRTYIDNSLTNDTPNAALSVTQNWNPGGGNGTYNDHPVGVRYDEKRGRWVIFNEDGATMPGGAAFNVALRSSTEKTD